MEKRKLFVGAFLAAMAANIAFAATVSATLYLTGGTIHAIGILGCAVVASVVYGAGAAIAID